MAPHIYYYQEGELSGTDPYIDLEIVIIQGVDGKLICSRVKTRAVDIDDKPIGAPNDYIFNDFLRYVAEYADGMKNHIHQYHRGRR